MVMGLEGSQETPKEELGLRPRINLRGVMRSISLLEPSESESTPEAGGLPEVFSSDEEPLHPFSQLSRAKGGQRVRKGPWPALKSRQSVVALHSAALVASRTRAFQEQGQGQEQSEPGMSSTPRLRKVMRQASVDDSREEDKA